MSAKRVLVTGGAGYIGSHVVKQLLNEGHKVIVFDNFSLGRRSNIDSRVETIIEGDVLNGTDLDKAFSEKIDAVFHFAAWKAAGESMTNPGKYAKNNIWGTLHLLNKMVEHGVKRFIFSSSAAVYGNPQYLPIDEKHPTNPTNYYGYTKLAIEENLAWYSRLMGLRYAALRYFNATGYDVDGQIRGKEKNPANLCPIIMEVLSGERDGMQVFGNDYNTKDGTCFRDYIHVNDLATAHVKAMNFLVDKNEDLVVNLGTGVGYTVLEMIKAAENVSGKKVNYKMVGRREGDPEGLVASSDLALHKMGWKAQYSNIDRIFESMAGVYLK